MERGRRTGCRRHRWPRCELCGLHDDLCICAELPQVTVGTHVLVVQHCKEVHKPTNTARLAVRMLAHAELRVHGLAGHPFDPGSLAATGVQGVLLFPGAGAPELTEELLPRRAGARRVLVVLDGTWNQTGRMARRLPVVRDLPWARLPDGTKNSWGIRKALDPSRLCTCEAVIEALRVLEGDQAVRPLRRAFAEATNRMWQMKRGRPGAAQRCPAANGSMRRNRNPT